jgi:thiamine-phosphate pyrophosphorylase
VIQLRAKDPTRRRALALAVRAVVRRAVFVVNDDPEVALAVGAEGVHLGDDDPSVGEARALLGPTALVGRSTRDLDAVAAWQHADYLGFGPIFETTTRLGSPTPRGIARLAEAVRVSSRPIVAIGGIRPDNVAAVAATGAWGWASVSALALAHDVDDVVARMTPPFP